MKLVTDDRGNLELVDVPRQELSLKKVCYGFLFCFLVGVLAGHFVW